MDHAVYPVATVVKAFESALTDTADRETAVHAAAQKLGIAAEVVREIVSPDPQEA